MNGYLADQTELYKTQLEVAKNALPGLYQELDALTPETEEYDKVLERIEYIQGAVVDWTQKLEENASQTDANKKKIKELQDQIRQKEIDLENEVLKVIEDREEKQKDMLQGRIDMENEIIEILKKQAETERDEILEAIDRQIDALNREKDALSENLSLRKEEAEQEDKLAELRAKEAQYARIIADPTRAKEAKELMSEIENLRDEIAWTQAENEVEAQEKSIDQQIDSLEDYKEFIEKYYDDLLNNPRNFIEQCEQILRMSDEEIMAWLSKNSEDFANSTDAAQQSMMTTWSETLDQMHGTIKTHWDEVQAIISQGEEYTINFLKENSREYAEASRLQQEAYLDGWHQMFEDIRNAYKSMQADILDTSGFRSTVTSGASSDSSSGGGGSGGGSGSGGSGAS